ncbi:hypothetical protein ACOBQX_23685 [Actinokineospora sp. G85]|uniref:hypothetical protein n=1 Tax=Actinokineospora sp. G85 TaxID=3406626 RepID=UPI003C777F66
MTDELIEASPERVVAVEVLAPLARALPAEEEERQGHIRIVDTVPNDGQWVPDRICECRDCGERYQVEHGEYHYPWWKWTEVNQPKNTSGSSD